MSTSSYNRKIRSSDRFEQYESDEDLTSYGDEPEHGLLSALLFDGVQAYLSATTSSNQEEKMRFEEAFLWVQEEDPDYVFSFNNVCDSLGIHPDALRLGLVNIMRSSADQVRRY